jgi:hypothetical protein
LGAQSTHGDHDLGTQAFVDGRHGDTGV